VCRAHESFGLLCDIVGASKEARLAEAPRPPGGSGAAAIGVGEGDRLIQALRPGTIACWRVDLEQPEARVAALAGVLAADERERAARFVFAGDCRRFVVTRASLRQLLGSACRMPAAAIRFVYGSHGKPALAPDLAAPTLHFSVSHSGELALIALTHDGPLGVDLEAIRPLPDLQDIAARFFADAEARVITALAPQERALAFFLCWTRKEAFVKALGDGLTLPLDRFRVACRPGERARILDIDGSASAGAEWSVYDVRPAPGFVGATVMRGAPRPLRLLRFDFDPGADT
jgi:4'-phosphopantetheinyl transferase